MDEAERCHRLAYLAYGNLLTRGTLSEVVASGNLTTWSVEGKGLRQLADQLRTNHGIDQVVAFGNILHVSSRNSAKLDAAIAALKSDQHKWTKIESGLEDVFIGLMGESKDNFS
jgi:ABC-2 type transport system ATP-binding protein